MGREATVRRRWLGVVALAGAIAMVVGGETVLQGRLSEVGFLAFWMVCLALTFLAMLAALLEVRTLRGRIRAEQRDLFTDILKGIQTDIKSKPRRPNGGDQAE